MEFGQSHPLTSCCFDPCSEVNENTIKHCFEKCRFGLTDVIVEKSVGSEFGELLDDFFLDTKVCEFVKLDNYVDICKPVANKLAIE